MPFRSWTRSICLVFVGVALITSGCQGGEDGEGERQAALSTQGPVLRGAPAQIVGINDCFFARNGKAIDAEGGYTRSLEDYLDAYSKAGFNTLRYGVCGYSIGGYMWLNGRRVQYKSDAEYIALTKDILQTARDKYGFYIWFTLFSGPGAGIPGDPELGDTSGLARAKVNYAISNFGQLVDIWEVANEADYVSPEWVEGIASYLHKYSPGKPVSMSWNAPAYLNLPDIDINSPHAYVPWLPGQIGPNLTQDITNIRNTTSRGLPLVYGEYGRVPCNWDAQNVAVVRETARTMLDANAGWIWWNNSGTKTLCKGGSSDQYLGPDERDAVLQELAKTPSSYCDVRLGSADKLQGSLGGSGSVTVTANPGCAWSASSDQGWLTITGGASGTGRGTISFRVATNTFNPPSTDGRARAASITVRNQTLGTQRLVIKQGARFADVDYSSSNPYASYIDKISAMGVTVGCETNASLPPRYCADQPVLRDQMAAFLIRALGMLNPPSPMSQKFTDVAVGSTFYAFIDQLWQQGITVGCTPTTYCPSEPVLHGQMAAFIMRARGLSNPPQPSSQAFDDVDSSNTFYAFIDQMAQQGIWLGCGGGNYCPNDPVNRQQMAEILVKGFGL